jgi:DNA polymerase III sliding clamp (beta) subunit (PCNA family)
MQNRSTVVEALCGLRRYERVQDTEKMLEFMGLTFEDTWKLLATDTPRVGTMEFEKMLTAKIVLLSAKTLNTRKGAESQIP